jgi:hypothetical protein
MYTDTKMEEKYLERKQLSLNQEIGIERTAVAPKLQN